MSCSACGGGKPKRRRAQRDRVAFGTLWLLYGVGGILARQQTIAIALQTLGMTLDLGSLVFSGHGFAAFMPYLAELAMISSVLAVVTGLALLCNREWSRVLAILTALLSLIKFPIGTLLGIYTLWVMLPEEIGDEDSSE